MPENWTFILLGACVVVLLGLFYYYVNRQIQSVQSAQHNLTNHVLYQQKVIDKHDQLFSQTLGVPRSFAAADTAPPGAVRQSPLSVPPGVSMDAPTDTPNPAAAFQSVASLGPMVGTILNMFQHMQPVEEAGEDDEDAVAVEPQISREDLERELSKELEELQGRGPQASQAPAPPTSPVRDYEAKKREGRVEEETPLTAAVAT